MPRSGRLALAAAAGGLLAMTALPGSAPAAARRTAAEFYARNPSGTMSCAIYDGYGGGPSIAMCESFGPRLEAKTTLSVGGVVTACQSHNPSANRCDLGNAGERTPTYGYGRGVTVGRFRCAVLRAGVKCTVVASGKGFLFSAGRTAAVGGARIRRTG